jgi:Domain of unknown function (DUF4259)
MSIWGPQPSANDDAADWLDDYLEAPDVLRLNDALDAVLDAGAEDYLEVTEGAEAVVAAAVVAEILGQAPADLIDDEDIRRVLLAKSAKLSKSARLRLVERAIAAVVIVTSSDEKSELFGLHHEDDETAPQWMEQINNLIAALEHIRGVQPTR